MDHAAIRADLLVEADALRNEARALRHTVDQTAMDLRTLTAVSRATIRRSQHTLDRVNRTLRRHQPSISFP